MKQILAALLMICAAPLAADDGLGFEQFAVDGRPVRVTSGESTATVVWFLGTECPMARLYVPRMSRLAADLAERNVQFVGVDSNRQDSVEEILEYARRQGVTFPVVKDSGNVLADRYGATRTPEVFLLDARLQIRYRGRIDDQYSPGAARPSPEREDLRIAVEQLLDGESISIAETEATGCLIGRELEPDSRPVVDNGITFTRHVMPVLQKHCVECHREGEIGPFAMQEYEEVAGWAETMLETIEDGRMPPWGADPEVGKFANARHMPEEDRQIIREWIAGGLKQGDPKDLPKREKYVSGWQLPREPDLVLPMRDRPYRVPAEGTVEYQYFVVDPGFEEDQWVVGAQIIPGARSVVHHAIAFLRPPDGVPLRGIGWLTAYVPGQRLTPLPPGHARKVPAGSRIVFQMHYTTNGTPADDITRIGLLLANPDEITHQLITLIGLETEFEIPPHASAHEVSAEVHWLPEGGRLLGVAPHMHYRGRSFELYADRGGETRMLLRVPRYDFNWQHSYEFAEPLPLHEIDRLHFLAAFDNSGDNPRNPDPDEWVTWGDQTWEEMAVAFFEVSEPLQSSDDSEAPPAEEAPDDAEDRKRERKVGQYIARVLQELDADGDGEVSSRETPIVVRRFQFGRFDADDDGVATREEIRAFAEKLF
jgi:AhpC/TSA family